MRSGGSRSVNYSKQKAQTKYKKAQLDKGIVAVNVRVPEEWAEALKAFAQQLLDGKNPDLAFGEAFPRDRDPGSAGADSLC